MILAVLFTFLIKNRYLKYLALLTFSLLLALNLESIYYNDSNLNLLLARNATNMTFILGSLFTKGVVSKTFAILLIIAIIFRYFKNFFLVSSKNLFIILVLSTTFIFFVKTNIQHASWTHASVFEDIISQQFFRLQKKTISYNFSDQRDAIKKIKQRQNQVNLILRKDLRGSKIIEGLKPKKVIIVMIEGLSQVHLNEDFMPKTFKLHKKALHFNRFISNQRQTNNGLLSILCGIVPNLSNGEAKTDFIANYTSPYECLPHIMHKAGYETTFVQAAPLSYMNKDLFAQNIGYQYSIGDDEFDDDIKIGKKWGVSDEYLYQKVESLLKRDKKQFFSILTVSTHHPFDNFKGNDGSFKTAINYADLEFYKFYQRLDKNGFLDDTILILTSDEASGDKSKTLSHNWAPLLVFNNKIRPQSIDTIFTQTDIPLSITDLLELESNFHGRSIFRNYNDNNRQIFFGNILQNKFYHLNIQDKKLTICNLNKECSFSSFDTFNFENPKDTLSISTSEVDEFIKNNDIVFSNLTAGILVQTKNKEISSKETHLIHALKVSAKSGEKLTIKFNGKNNSSQKSRLYLNIYNRLNGNTKSLKFDLLPGSDFEFNRVYKLPKKSIYSLDFYIKEKITNTILIKNFSISKE